MKKAALIKDLKAGEYSGEIPWVDDAEHGCRDNHFQRIALPVTVATQERDSDNLATKSYIQRPYPSI